MNKIAYLHAITTPGYGSRIYIPYELLADEGVARKLKTLSMWEGSDKDTGKCKGYEFGDVAYEMMQVYLGQRGIKLEPISEANEAMVWA